MGPVNSSIMNVAEYNELQKSLLFPDMWRYMAELKVDPTRAPDVWRALKVRGDSVYWRREFKKALRVYRCIFWMKATLFGDELLKTRDQTLFDKVMCYIALGDLEGCLATQLAWNNSNRHDPKFLSDSSVFNAIQRSAMTVEQRREFLRGVQTRGYCLEEKEQDIVENEWSRKYTSEKALFTSKMGRAKHLFTLGKYRQASELYSEMFQKMNMVSREDLATVLYNRASTYIALGSYHHDKARDDLRDILMLRPAHKKVIEKYNLLETGGGYIECDIIDINSNFLVSSFRRQLNETPSQKYAQILSGKEEYKSLSPESIIPLVEVDPNNDPLSFIEQCLAKSDQFESKRFLFDALNELQKADIVYDFLHDRNLWSTLEESSKTRMLIGSRFIAISLKVGELTLFDTCYEAFSGELEVGDFLLLIRDGLMSDKKKKRTLSFLQERGHCLQSTEADFYPSHPDDKPDRPPYQPMTDEQRKRFTDWIVGWFAPSSTESQNSKK